MSVVSVLRLTGLLAGLRRRIRVLCQPRSENCPGLPIFFGEADLWFGLSSFRDVAFCELFSSLRGPIQDQRDGRGCAFVCGDIYQKPLAIGRHGVWVAALPSLRQNRFYNCGKLRIRSRLGTEVKLIGKKQLHAHVAFLVEQHRVEVDEYEILSLVTLALHL